MDSFSRKEIVIGRLKFITMSLIGILLFLVPIPVEQDGQKQTTLPVAFLAGVLKDVLGGVNAIFNCDDNYFIGYHNSDLFNYFKR